ncbi:hypothetical protein GWI33_011630 [Rhynchophorus ferrugineus]|uniref:Uncharacterized protein n=1 Tax=Rhynchophorus ferrugineus TaxID=354439 RepID=A0A834I9Y8_RHYFE|nr:hypothetical protein GWI33_011630 [Rhynchophorus ferrugineus]
MDIKKRTGSYKLLSILCVFNEEIQCIAEKQMCGTTLKPPEETFRTTESKINEAENATFVKKLKSAIRQLKPVKTTNHAKEKPYVNADFLEVPIVFVRTDQAKTPLSPSYEGPFRVLHRKEKYFKIDKIGNEDEVSVDRLKPAYISQESQIYEEHSY